MTDKTKRILLGVFNLVIVVFCAVGIFYMWSIDLRTTYKGTGYGGIVIALIVMFSLAGIGVCFIKLVIMALKYFFSKKGIYVSFGKTRKFAITVIFFYLTLFSGMLLGHIIYTVTAVTSLTVGMLELLYFKSISNDRKRRDFLR